MVEKVTRQRKFQSPLVMDKGVIIEQIGPPLSGKSQRANAWAALDPEHRRVVDGDRAEAEKLINEGYNVVLNLLSSEFHLSPLVLAQLIAAHVSGLEDAIPEQDDLNLACRFIDLIEKEYSD